MAEEQKTTVEEPKEEQVDAQQEVEATEKTFTQAQLDEIIQKEKAKAKRSAEKEYQAKMDEAEKLRQMNETQKQSMSRKNKKHTLLNWKLKSIVAD